MSSVTIITAIIVLLAALVCYAFISQTMTQKRQKKERLLASLKTRVRNFEFMLQNTPGGYLTRELKLLIERSLAQILEQLIALEPSSNNYKSDLAQLHEQMAQTREGSQSNGKKLENPQQAREIKACLEELYRYIFTLESRRTLNRGQADAYRAMVKHAAYELTADSYVIHGRVAREKEKPRLAIHYYDLAIKLLAREGRNGQFDQRIAQLKTMIAELQDHLDGSAPTTPEELPPANEEWANFGKDDNSWKKKQVYD